MRLGSFAALGLVLAMSAAGRVARATGGTADPSMSQAQLAAMVDALAPGDTLVLAPGTYEGRTLDLVHADGSPLAGTSAAPITIKGDSTGQLPHVVAHTDEFQEAVRFGPGAAFIVLSDLRLSSVGSGTQAGIRVEEGTHDVTISGCEIFDVTGIGIQIQTINDVHDLVIVDNHIHDTGTNTSDGNNGGQGFTAGGFTSGSATTGVYRLLLRHNLIHDTRGQEGDCMKFMYGVYQSAMEDNVAYNCPRGVAQAENYGFTAYGSGPGHSDDAADDNVIRRNLLANTRGVDATENNVAIYVGPGTLVENNVVVQANIGIAARLEDEVASMRNLRVVHNTVYDVSDHAFSIRGTQASDGSVVVANNAFVTVDPNAFGYRAPDPLGGMVFVANYFTGQEYQEASPPAVNLITQSDAQIFAAPSSAIDQADFMPLAGSLLVDAADGATALADDFDLAARPFGGAADVGAYELRDDLADHWQIGAGFKGSQGAGPIPPTGSSTSGAGGGPSSGSSGAGGADGDGAGDDGCSCRAGARSKTGGASVGVWLALLGAWARRRRSAS